MATYGRSKTRLLPHQSKPTLGEQHSPNWRSKLVSRTPELNKHASSIPGKQNDDDDVFAFPGSDDEAARPARFTIKKSVFKQARNPDLIDHDKTPKQKRSQPLKIPTKKKKIPASLIVSKPGSSSGKSSTILASPVQLEFAQSKEKRIETPNILGFDDTSEDDRKSIATTPGITRQQPLSAKSTNDVFDFPDQTLRYSRPTKSAAKPVEVKRGRHTSEPPTAKVKKMALPNRNTRILRSTSKEPSTSPGVEGNISKPSQSARAVTNPKKSTSSQINKMHTPASPKNHYLQTPSPTGPQTPRAILASQPITPQQTALWDRLLSNSITSTMPSVSKLNLDSTIKQSKRSLDHSYQPNKRTKLTDLLKPANTIQEEDYYSDLTDSIVSEDESQALQPNIFQSQSKARVRYGQKRGFVQDKGEEAMFDMLIDDLEVPVASQKQPQLDLGLESDDEINQPRTMHELKAAGSKRRALTEFEHILDGIQGDELTTASAQRSEFLELTKKIMDPQKLSLLLDHSLESRLIEAASTSKDVSMHFISSICFQLLIDGSTNLNVIRNIRDSRFMSHVLHLLNLDQDITKFVKDRAHKMSKAAQTSLVRFTDHVLTLDPWSGLKKLTPQLAACSFLERLVRKTRESGSDEQVLNEKIITQLLDIVADHQESTESFSIVRLAMSTLESCSIGMKTNKNSWSSLNFQKLGENFPQLLNMESCLETSSSISFLAIRLLLNVTSDNLKACGTFAEARLLFPLLQRICSEFLVMNRHHNKEKYVVDELVLTLGATINLVEANDTIKSQVLEDDGKLLKNLVEIFSSKQNSLQDSQSVEESTLNVPYGYLAILLVNFCQHDNVRPRVLSLLRSSQLHLLISAAEDFIHINQRTDAQLFAGTDGEKVFQSYNDQLLNMVNDLKALV